MPTGLELFGAAFEAPASNFIAVDADDVAAASFVDGTAANDRITVRAASLPGANFAIRGGEGNDQLIVSRPPEPYGTIVYAPGPGNDLVEGGSVFPQDVNDPDFAGTGMKNVLLLEGVRGDWTFEALPVASTLPHFNNGAPLYTSLVWRATNTITGEQDLFRSIHQVEFTGGGVALDIDGPGLSDVPRAILPDSFAAGSTPVLTLTHAFASSVAIPSFGTLRVRYLATDGSAIGAGDEIVLTGSAYNGATSIGIATIPAGAAFVEFSDPTPGDAPPIAFFGEGTSTTVRVPVVSAQTPTRNGSLQIDGSTVDEGGSVRVTFSLDAPAAGAVSVQLTLEGNGASRAAAADFAATSFQGTIAAGQTAVTFEVPVSDDTAAEEAEGFLVRVVATPPAGSVLTGGTAMSGGAREYQATGTIGASDGTGPVTVVAAIGTVTLGHEQNATPTITVTFDRPLVAAATVTLALTGGASSQSDAAEANDFQAFAPVAVAAGQSSVQIPVSLVNDLFPEATENATIAVTVSSSAAGQVFRQASQASGAAAVTLSADVFCADNDAGNPQLAEQFVLRLAGGSSLIYSPPVPGLASELFFQNYLPLPDTGRAFLGDVWGTGNSTLVFDFNDTSAGGRTLVDNPALGANRFFFADASPGGAAQARVAALADVDGDGKAEIIRYDGGTQLTIDDPRTGANLLTMPVQAGTQLGVADFDGNGRADLLFRAPGGAALILDVATLSFRDVPEFSAGYSILAVGNFLRDGAGRVDEFLVWNETTRESFFVRFPSSAGLEFQNFLQFGGDFRLVSVGDLHGDGIDELILDSAERGFSIAWTGAEFLPLGGVLQGVQLIGLTHMLNPVTMAM